MLSYSWGRATPACGCGCRAAPPSTLPSALSPHAAPGVPTEPAPVTAPSAERRRTGPRRRRARRQRAAHTWGGQHRARSAQTCARVSSLRRVVSAVPTVALPLALFPLGLGLRPQPPGQGVPCLTRTLPLWAGRG
eukprot:413446-Pyramimonas_sp.AAC.1